MVIDGGSLEIFPERYLRDASRIGASRVTVTRVCGWTEASSTAVTVKSDFPAHGPK